MFYSNYNHLAALEEKMKYSILALAIFVLSGCGDSPKYEDFINLGPGKTEESFYEDSLKCETDKVKFSSLIKGRELGFKGKNTAFLGCMKEKGWEQKQPGLY